MAQVTLAQILNQITTLDVEELRQISQAVQGRLSADGQARNLAAFHEALLTAGVVKQIKPRRAADVTERRLIEVQGKPVSETIIEERR